MTMVEWSAIIINNAIIANYHSHKKHGFSKVAYYLKVQMGSFEKE